MTSSRSLTVEHVYVDAGRSSVGRYARIVAAVHLVRRADRQDTTLAVTQHRHSSLLVVVDHAVSVVPEDEHGRLSALPQRADEPQLTAALDV